MVTTQTLLTIDYNLYLSTCYRLLTRSCHQAIIEALFDIVAGQLVEDKLIGTTLTKRTQQKLLLDCTIKVAFLFDNNCYEQTDGVSIGSCLALMLANIILMN